MNKHDILLKNPTDKTALSSCWSTSKNLCTLEKNTFSFYLTEAVVCEIFPLWRVPNTVQSDQREIARNKKLLFTDKICGFSRNINYLSIFPNKKSVMAFLERFELWPSLKEWAHKFLRAISFDPTLALT